MPGTGCLAVLPDGLPGIEVKVITRMHVEATRLAVQAISDKAQRILRRHPATRTSDVSKREEAAALLLIAAELSGNADRIAEARAMFPAGLVVAPRAQQRRLAAKEVYALALQRHERATGQAGDSDELPAGWIQVEGGSVHPQQMRLAIALMRVALSLHLESYWAYTMGLWQQRLGDYAAAAGTFEAVTPPYDQFSRSLAKRCRKLAAGQFGAAAERDFVAGQFRSAIATAAPGQADQQQDLVRAMIGALDAVDTWDSDMAVAPGPPPKEEEPQSPIVDSPAELRLEQACRTAQEFAECLGERQFEAAAALLARTSRLRPSSLRTRYTRMMQGSLDSPEICVMTADAHMPRRRAADLGWVYVAISNNEVNEAVAVVVTLEETEPRIRSVEWGRP